MHDMTVIERAIAESIVAEPEVQELPAVIDPRVQRGVEFLDENVPEWWTMINLKTFNIRLANRCVVGQITNKLFGYDYSDAGYWTERCRVLGMDMSDHDPYRPDYRLGFNYYPLRHGSQEHSDYYAEQEAGLAALEQDWRIVIAERQL